MADEQMDILKYIQAKASQSGLTASGPHYHAARDATYYLVSNGQKAFALSLSGLEKMQNGAEQQLCLVDTRFANGVSALTEAA